MIAYYKFHGECDSSVIILKIGQQCIWRSHCAEYCGLLFLAHPVCRIQ